ncbi:MAG: beta strand repeat-containing protein, partial [Elsteraceae bacterium]
PVGAGTVSLGGGAASAGLQNYSGSVVLTSDASFSTSGANVIFQGAVDAASAGGQSLTAALGGGTLNLLGGVGGGSALSSLSADGATAIGGGGVSTAGSQSYGGAVTLTADVTLSSSGQAVAFGGAVDGGYAFTVSGTSVSFSGAVGGVTALTSLSVAASGSGGLALPAVTATDVSLNVGGGTVTQSGAITAASLELLATGASYSLTNADNAISVLAGNLDSLTLVNGPLASLTIGTAGSTTGVTAAGSVSITQTGAGQSVQIDKGVTSVGSVALASASTISGSGMITGSSLVLSALSGTLTVATGVPIPGPVGSFIVNGVPLTTPSPPSVPSSGPTATSVTPAVQTPSVTQPVITVLPVTPVAPSAPTTPPVVTADLPAPQPPAAPSPPVVGPGIKDQLNGILLANQPTDNRLDLTMNLNGGRGAGGLFGVQLGPRTPPVVAETGARLASAQTILLDAADAAGSGGQVVASNLDVFGGAGKRVVIPGLLLTDPELARRGLFREDIRDLIVPQINEEPLLD